MQKWTELAELVNEVALIKPEIVVEIGCGKGGTAWAWSKFSSIRELILIDLPSGPWGGSPQEEMAQHLKYVSDNSIHCKVSYLAGNSRDPDLFAEVQRILGGRSVDFLFIDGDHSEDGVRSDYEVYAPLVRDGGIVALHDVVEHDPSQQCYVDKFWATVTQPKIEVIHEPKTWGGIGIVRR
jgi:cephalosporin hydroxylase